MKVQTFFELFHFLAERQVNMNEESNVLIHTEAGSLFNVHGMRYDETRNAWVIVGAPL